MNMPGTILPTYAKMKTEWKLHLKTYKVGFARGQISIVIKQHIDRDSRVRSNQPLILAMANKFTEINMNITWSAGAIYHRT